MMYLIEMRAGMQASMASWVDRQVSPWYLQPQIAEAKHSDAQVGPNTKRMVFISYIQVIKLLIQNKSPVDAVNNKGWTPLHRAAYNGRRLAVVALIESGAQLQVVTKDGNTPLHLACYMNHLSTIEVCGLELLVSLIANTGLKKTSILACSSVHFAVKHMWKLPCLKLMHCT